MANTNHKKKPADNSPGIMKYVFTVVILMIAGYFAYTSFIKKPDITEIKPYDPTEKFKNIKEPQFMKEGELEFLSKDGKTVIKKIDVEIADNDPDRSQGLMYRRSMDENRGMLFIFQHEQMESFWMKNTIMSLDIIYVNSKKEIVKIFRHTTPFSESSLASGNLTLYVVEVVAGFTDKYKITEGDMISFTKN
ncbi:MAG: DUF192 domain-containing protein [bacterium]|nr:DUF192 domain-containing protein [bacterium]